MNFDQEPVIKETDWMLDGYSGITEDASATTVDWLDFSPTPENQARRDKFVKLSTPACTNFGNTNAIEFQINRIKEKLSSDAIEELDNAGFFDGGGYFNLSDSFSAATSGTTKDGNSAWRVAETIRNIGCCSQRVREWSDDMKTWEQFIAKPTKEQYENAKLLLKHFDFKQQWVFTDHNDKDKWEKMRRAVKIAPLIVSVPCCDPWFRLKEGATVPTCSIDVYTSGESRHAVVQPRTDVLYDSYDPHVKLIEEGKYPIVRAFQMVVSIKEQTPPTARFTRDLFVGRTGKDVKELQRYLNRNGFIVATYGAGSLGNETEYFGQLTKIAVMAYQKAHADKILRPAGLNAPTGFVGAYTRAVLNTS